MHPAGEEEAARSRPDAALKQGPYIAPAGQPTAAGEQGVLLAKDAGGADLDHGRA